MLRRVLTVRIIVDTDKPELRPFDFDPVDEALANRGEILAAGLTILRAWWLHRDTEEGKRIRKTKLGSFGEWSDIVAGTVEWLTGINPITLIEARKAEDARASDDHAIIAALYDWQTKRTQNGKGLTWLSKDARTDIDKDIWAGVISFKGDRPSVQQVAEWLKRHRDCVFAIQESTDDKAPRARVQLTASQGRARQTKWGLRRLEDGEPVNRGEPDSTRRVSEIDKNGGESEKTCGPEDWEGISGSPSITGSPSSLDGEMSELEGEL